ncbi:MAG TPA: NUDIX hydrolase [Candidatus Saccharimonadales bacterium]|nr:NUDIX hydrolase [Candidatus Saccharimonadales bacterium]
MINCTFENGNKASLRHVVVDVLVLQENKLLLVKRAGKLLEGGKWALVGGYAERDENLFQTAEREIQEETGYTVKNLTLLCMRHNPDRPHEDRQNIAFVFFCDAVAHTGESDWEVTEQKWYEFDALPDKDTIAFDHMKNIELYQQYKQNKITIPVMQS